MKSPRELGLPFDDWRPGQQLAIRTALHAKTSDTVIQSPTGTGKSTIAAALAKLERGRTGTLTATRPLEDQYTKTFDFMYDVRGMGNYECLLPRSDILQIRRKGSYDRPRMCDDGPCRSGLKCELKEDGCLYFDRYRGALASSHMMTNYAYWLAMRRFSKGLGTFSRLNMDEAHALPEQLMSAYRIEIPLTLLREGNTPRSHGQWARWAMAKAEEIKPKGDSEDNRQRKQRVVEQLVMLQKIDETWAWDVYDNKVVFEPTIPRLLFPLLADDATAPKRVYLSATITPSTLRLLGIPKSDVTFKAMKSRFPASRRPVYLVDCTRVDHKMSREQIEWWLSRHDKIISKRLDRRGIIHTVSYQRMWDILKGSRYRKIMIAPKNASELGYAVEQFKRTRPPVILISPSVATGFDFPYEAAEYQILSKLPFPDTRSAIARARIEATEGYRDHLTAQGLQQACGRINRAFDDSGETFILDNHAQWFIRYAEEQGLLADWFLESIVRLYGKHYHGPDIPAPLPKLAA